MKHKVIDSSIRKAKKNLFRNSICELVMLKKIRKKSVCIISTYSAKNHIDVLISKGFQQIGSSFGRMFLHVVDSLKCMWHELGI